MSALAILRPGSKPSVVSPVTYAADSNRNVTALENTSGFGGAGSGEAL